MTCSSCPKVGKESSKLDEGKEVGGHDGLLLGRKDELERDCICYMCQQDNNQDSQEHPWKSKTTELVVSRMVKEY